MPSVLIACKSVLNRACGYWWPIDNINDKEPELILSQVVVGYCVNPGEKASVWAVQHHSSRAEGG